jgi:protein-S-isoprenylcysteine O-methyltransferase Ste14
MQKHTNCSRGRTPSTRWFAKVDQWVIFNPAGWPRQELISRVTALTIFAGIIGLRVYNFDRFPQFFEDAYRFYGAIKTTGGTPLYSMSDIRLLWGIKLAVWIIETAVYAGYIASYASRDSAVSIAKGFLEAGFPLLVAGLPFLILFMPYSLPQWLPFSSTRHFAFFQVIMGLIVLGGMINLVGLITLRRSFAIMSEARTLITHGIFRFVRHPLYTGHFIMFFGSMLLRLSLPTVLLYLLFLAGQVFRARIEERKLESAFPDYATYKDRTGMFIPKIGKILGG